jgi:hypothetical protein
MTDSVGIDLVAELDHKHLEYNTGLNVVVRRTFYHTLLAKAGGV